MEKISIIIPIFNSESFLKKCVESALAQTYPNIEIVLVNDGSKDLSGEICDEIASVSPLVKVIHKANSGALKARETGVEKATGDFVFFLDSDDTIQKDALSKMMEYADNNTDIVVFETNEENRYSPKDWVGAVLQRKSSWTQWGKLYRRTLFDKWVSDFSGINIGEDFIFNLRISKNLKGAVVCVPESRYNYCVTSSSAMSKYKHNLEYELHMLQTVRETVQELPYDLEKEHFYYEINMLTGFVAHGLKVDPTNEWVIDLLNRSKKYRLNRRQRYAIESFNNRLPRMILRGEKIIKTGIKRLLMHKGAR